MTGRAATRVLVRAGTVRTMADRDPVGRGGVLVDGDRIAAVLDEADAEAVARRPDVTVVDLGDRALVPGFVDPHAHAEVACVAEQTMVDVRAPRCSSVADVLAELRRELHRARDGWLVAQANLFFDRKLADGRFPTRDELDSVSADTAVVIRAGGHLSILNSCALRLAGIDEAYEETQASITGRPRVERDAAGRPTGVVREMDKLLPLPSLTEDELRGALASGLRTMFTARGVTTLGEITDSRTALDRYDELLTAGRLAVRLNAYLWVPGTVSLDEACAHEEWASFSSPSNRLRVAGVKVWADGGYSAASAALSEPYAVGDGHHCGEVSLSGDDLLELVRRTRAAGLQLAIHANGDRAQLEVCDAVRRATAEPEAGATPQHVRIEHAGNFVPDYDRLTAAWRSAGIVPVPQPVFIKNFAEFLPDYVGARADTAQFPLRRLLADGWTLSGSSDVWVGSEVGQSDPLLSISSAVRRRTFHDRVLAPDEGVTIEQAFRMHTIGGATALGLQDEVGSIATGKLADLVVLDRDPFAVDPTELVDLRVDEVYLGGVRVFEAAAV